ncbi:MAG TPA: hypothetical protein VFN10_14960 [Thermoanaerobaculia bacterium]|nr:hypothetical protein [Thermoanaerobaculia bacterium]
MKSAAKTKPLSKRPKKVVLKQATVAEILETAGVTKTDMKRARAALEAVGFKVTNPPAK